MLFLSLTLGREQGCYAARVITEGRSRRLQWKNNKICSIPTLVRRRITGGSPPIASRVQQKSFKKCQQEDYPDRANTGECNLYHVGVVSTDLAKVQFTAGAVLRSLI